MHAVCLPPCTRYSPKPEGPCEENTDTVAMCFSLQQNYENREKNGGKLAKKVGLGAEAMGSHSLIGCASQNCAKGSGSINEYKPIWLPYLGFAFALRLFGPFQHNLAQHYFWARSQQFQELQLAECEGRRTQSEVT